MKIKFVPLAIILTISFCLHSTWVYAQGIKPYQDPDEITLLDKESINNAVKSCFSKKDLCSMKKGYMIFSCKLDSQGRITNIATKKIDNISISERKLFLFKNKIAKEVMLHIPSALKTKETSRFRQTSIVIPFKGYCK